MARHRGGRERNNRGDVAGKTSSTGWPAGAARGFDPLFRPPRTVGRSLHVDGCRMSTIRHQAAAWVGGAGRSCLNLGQHRPRSGVDIPRNLRRNSREQAYLPAEQPSPSQGARLPPAHADPRRSLDPVEPSPQGPQETGGLTARAHGTRRAPRCPPPHRQLTTSVAPSAAGDVPVRATLVVHLWVDADAAPAPAQVGFTVSKAVGNAATRNRVKRRLRHLTREHLADTGGASGSCCSRGPCAAGRGRGVVRHPRCRPRPYARAG